MWLSGKESACNVGDLGLVPGLGRSPGKGKGYPLQYFGLENSTDCIVHGVAKSQTRLRDFTFFSFYSQCCSFHGSGQLKMTYIQHINIILSIFTALKSPLCSIYLSFFSSHCIHFYFKTYTCQSVGKMWHPSSFRVIHVGWWCLWRYYEINKGQKEDINNVSSSVTAFDGVCLWLEALWGGNTNLKVLIKVNAK